MSALIRVVAVVLALVAGTVGAQPVRGDNIESELVAATDAAVPGQPLAVALRLKHDPHWHTYWQVPGDSGLPTQIKWRLPPGWQAGPIAWPVPQRFPVGPLMNFGYDGEVLLLTTLTPPPGLAVGGSVEFAARADWLICKDVCIPGGADLKLTLPVRQTAAPSRHAAQFAAARSRIPQPVALEAASATIEAARIRFAFKPRAANAAPASVEFFPLEEGRIEPAAPQILRREGDLAALYLTAAQPVAAGFDTLKGVLVVDGGPARADRGGWAGIVSVPLAAGAVPVVTAAAQGQGGAPVTLWLALAGAFVGGLLLNLMPCVFPVLSLKLLGLVQRERAEDAAQVAHLGLRAHGLAYAAGVVGSFVLLAAGLIALRAAGAELGWGFQLQTPWVVAALTTLFFLIGLNLLGAFEFTWGSGLANTRVGGRLAGDRLSGSFGTGILAVIVAAPCTAPFMGAALGYAITQPAAIALAVFALLGVGMAAPYVVLTAFPRLLVRLPRPGAWMERFRQSMAFPMFATCVWLLWVLAQQVDVDAVGLVLLALVLLGLAAWAFGLAQRGAQRYRWVALGAALAAVYATISATGAESGAGGRAQAAVAADAAQWQPWSRAAMAQAIATGRPVFVDFTAAWCVTCQVNKRLVLSTAPVEDAFRARGVALMRADWTNRDPEITQELARFNRNGVPLYVLYDGKGGAHVLPELLTARTVLDALARL